MAGGIGSRFWPMSTPQNPKQFLDVLGIGKTLIQMTFERLAKISPVENIYVMTNVDYKDLVLEQLPLLKADQVLTEPQRKNTAPCIAYAAAKIQSLNKNANLIVSPADHLILQEDKFVSDINDALEVAKNGRIATIGIQPTRPDTGYGYIEFDKSDSASITKVKQFREKPNLELANEFLKAGNFYWNSGVFVWSSKTILDSLNKFQPELFQLFAGSLDAYNTEKEQSHVNQAFELCDDISIDYAIMEHADNIDVVKSNFDWSDLGTWGSLDTHLEKDKNNNAIVGGNVVTNNVQNSIVNVPEGTEVILDGLQNYIVIQTNDKLMILKKENEQQLKAFMAKL